MNKETKFVTILRKVMAEKSLSQYRLAKILGMRQSQISNWLNGKSLPNYLAMQLLKTKLAVSTDAFFE